MQFGRLFLLLVAAACVYAQPTQAVEIDGRLVAYQIQGGYAVTQGDIILGTAEEVGAAARGDRRSAAFEASSAGNPRLWADATLYYFIDPSIRFPERVQQAVDHWNARTPLKLVPRTNEPDFVRVQRITSGCSSFVGFRGGEQALNLEDACDLGAVIHEFGHALGLSHEQERPDRNTHVSLLYENVEPVYYSQYDQRSTTRAFGYYDYGSIMHYSPVGFSREGRDTIETNPPGIPLGQRRGLSAQDIDAASRLYGFVPETTTITTVPDGLTIEVDGERAVSPASYRWTRGSRHRITVVALQGALPRYQFVRWTDGGDVSHEVTADPELTAIAAIFQAQNPFRATVSAGDGQVQVRPAPQGGFLPDRQPIQLTTLPGGAAQFLSWSGSTDLNIRGFGIGSATPTVQSSLRGTLYQASFTPNPVTTIDTTPAGRTVIVDATTYVAPVRFTWAPGSQHTLSTSASQSNYNGGARFAFADWDDKSTARVRTIAAGERDALYAARFTAQYRLNLTTAGQGSVQATPSSTDNFYDENTEVTLRAVPRQQQTLRYWIWDAAGGGDVKTLRMTGEKSAAAIFGSELALRPVNAASYAGDAFLSSTGTSVAPLEIVTIFGPNVGPPALASGTVTSNRLDTRTGNTRVLFDNVPAPILYASANQTSVIVPAAVAARSATTIRVEREGVAGLPVAYPVIRNKPGLFTANASGSGLVAALNENGSVHSVDNPASAGSVMVLYATGAGLYDRPVSDGELMGANLAGAQVPVLVRFGKLAGEVLYAGSAPGIVAGALQINVRIPADALAGETPIQIIVGNTASPPGPTVMIR